MNSLLCLLVWERQNPIKEDAESSEQITSSSSSSPSSSHTTEGPWVLFFIPIPFFLRLVKERRRGKKKKKCWYFSPFSSSSWILISIFLLLPPFYSINFFKLWCALCVTLHIEPTGDTKHNFEKRIKFWIIIMCPPPPFCVKLVKVNCPNWALDSL